MKTLARIARISGAAVMVLAAAWLLLPTALGGSATYVSTFGTSMEPGFTAGDLAILRPATDYRVGDVVAYDSTELGTTVMHRIVDGDADGFVMQGDNNSWLDEEKPSESEVMGRLWLQVPQGGKAITALRSPWVLALIGAAALVVVLAARKPRGRHHRSPVRTPRRPRVAMASVARAPRRPRAFSMPTRARARQAMLVSAVVALLAGVAGVALVLLPDTQTDSRKLQVTQQGRFAYTGAAVAGTTYPSGVIATGDTVWTRLTDGLTVSFEDVVTGADPAAVDGTVRLDVSVQAPDGWSATLTSGPTATLADGAATASVVLDPAGAAALLQRHYDEVGTAGGSATLTVVPRVDVTGTVEGRPFTAAAPDGLSFTLDETALRLAGESSALAPTTRTAVTVEELAPRAFTLGALTASVGIVRIAAAALFAVALLVLAGAAWIGRSPRGDTTDDFLVRHAARLLPVTSFVPGNTVIDVTDAEALHRVAERLDSLVLHQTSPYGDTFAVQDAETTYRYVVAKQRPSRPSPDPVTTASRLLGRFA
jgi:signal peptidase I